MGQPTLVGSMMQLPQLNNTHIELHTDNNQTFATCDFHDRASAFFFWNIDDLDTGVREIHSGIGKWQIDISQWLDKRYRIRTHITLAGNTQRKLFELLNQTDFIQRTAASFKSDHNQDNAHKAILKQLLSTPFSRRNVAFDDPASMAYEAIRWNTPNAPIHQIRDQDFPLHVSHNAFFIRDYMQCQLSGGTAQSPLIIGDKNSTGTTRNGLQVVDEMVDSVFAQAFDQIVTQINQQLPAGKAVTPFEQLAHCDAIQLIPRDTSTQRISHFAGALMKHIRINGNNILSRRALQGIFASDGVFKDLHITNNTVQIGGSHTISISGMLSGKIEGNTDLFDAPLPQDKINLYPLRIGGGRNIFVMSFANPVGMNPDDDRFYAYEPIQGNQVINDLRHVKPNKPGATHWDQVNLPALQAAFPDALAEERTLKNNHADAQEIQTFWNTFMQQFGTPA